MRLRNVRIKNFRRFHELTIQDLPVSARLVVLVGPNGCGKSSVFDAFNVWYRHSSIGGSYDGTYHAKQGLPQLPWSQNVELDWHQELPNDRNERKKLFYLR